MQKFTRFTSKAVPLNRANVDTDQIIPKQFLLAVDRKGFGHHLFHDHRWLDAEETKPNPDFVLNFPVYKGAGILVAQANFGNGSSREHAPWALLEYGFRCVIAPSFADIFKNNALGNGLLPVELKQSEIDQLFQVLEANPGMEITVDLEKQTVDAGSLHFTFTVDPFRRWMMLEGLDAIGLTLQDEDKIAAYEASMHAWRVHALHKIIYVRKGRHKLPAFFSARIKDP